MAIILRYILVLNPTLLKIPVQFFCKLIQFLYIEKKQPEISLEEHHMQHEPITLVLKLSKLLFFTHECNICTLPHNGTTFLYTCGNQHVDSQSGNPDLL